MELKVKPCPVCGQERAWVFGNAKDDVDHFYIFCKKCGYKGPVCTNEQEAKAAWNGVFDAMHQQETPTTRKTILEAAITCVCKERNDQYGEPEDCFQDIANLWAAYKGVDFDPFDVAMMMSLLKVARAKANPQHTDNYVDLCGYGSIAGELANKDK